MTLGDTPERDYGWKLDAFWQMVERDVRPVVRQLLPRGSVLDAGCGTGTVATWLADDGCTVTGVDLSVAHVERARQRGVDAVTGDIARLDLGDATLDGVWCANTLHHVDDREGVVAELRRVLRPGGRLVVAQSSMVPDLVFSWDARLERLVNDACRLHYALRYGLDTEALSAPRDTLGLLRRAGFGDVTVHTVAIDRFAPLDSAARHWLQEVLFDSHWRGKADDHLPPDDLAVLLGLIDPASPTYCLDRDDFHHLQTLTITTGLA